MENTYLTDTEMASLVEAIRAAEAHSTGEIRVHLHSGESQDLAKTAMQTFESLGMKATRDRNAVLFHIDFGQRYLTIIGDEGIHAVVHQPFWDRLHDEITRGFSQGKYFEPLRTAILETGLELKRHFPILTDNPNELSDEITFS